MKAAFASILLTGQLLAQLGGFDDPAFISSLSAPAASGGSVTWLIDEGAEGTEPASFTNSAAGVTWGSTEQAAAGTRSIKLDSTTADAFIQIPFTSGDPRWTAFAWYPTRYHSTDALVARFYGSAGQVLGLLEHRASGVLRVQSQGGSTAATTGPTGTNAWVYIWVTNTKGTGLNASTEVRWSTTKTRPGTGDAAYRAISSNGTNMLDTARLQILSDNVGTVNGHDYFDFIHVDDAEITDLP